jgi:phage terminase large subunit-like protein
MIADFIERLGDLFDIREIAVDRWGWAYIAGRLNEAGFPVIGVGQGYKDMSPACKELESVLLSGRLRHGANPVLEWNAANIAVSRDGAENLKPDKAASTERTDVVVALIMALGRAATYAETGTFRSGAIAFV